MYRDKKGLSLGTILTLILTVVVVVGCIVFFSAFKSEGDVAMGAKIMAGLLEEAIQTRTEEDPSATVRTVTVTLAPVNLTPSSAAETPKPSPQVHRVTMTVGGLLSFGSEISDSVYEKTQADCDYTAILEPLQTHLTNDVNAVVFPQMLGAEKRNYSDLKVSASAAQALGDAGFDTVLLHSGTIMEQGAQNALNTAKAFHAADLRAFGVNAENAAQHGVLKINGLSIAVFSYAVNVSNTVKNLLQSAAGQGLMRLYAEETAKREIQKAREEGADAVVVFIHWGKAGQEAVTEEMRSTARTLANAGADVILGTGPSRLMPVEKLRTDGETGEKREAIAVYSLGTLLSESREAQDIAGALLHITLEGEGNGHCTVAGLSCTPTYIWRQSIGGKNQYRVLIANEAPPQEMSEKQREVMGRALERVKGVWDEGMTP